MRGTSAEQAFRRFIAQRDYPCVMARSALERDQLTIHTYRTLDIESADGSTADQLARDLTRFANAPEPERGFRSFVAIFDGEPPPTELAFEAALWAVLRCLAARDDAEWDGAVASDPEDASFSFSFAGRAFFVVGLHPHASRPARRCHRTALAFNLHDQFERLRSSGRFRRVRALIRARDRAFAGSVNPMLDDFGRRSEARQYSGRALEPDWRCPFHTPG